MPPAPPLAPPPPLRHLSLWLLLGCLLTLRPGPAAAQSEEAFFRVERTQVDQRDGRLRVDADLIYHLNDTAREAISSGVPLTLEWSARLLQRRDWIWDDTLAEVRHGFRLTYFALGDRYLVHRQHDGVTLTYLHLNDALAAIGRVRDLDLAAADSLTPGQDHYGEFRGELIVEELPTPVRLWAYISSEWRLISDWQAWPVDLATMAAE